MDGTMEFIIKQEADLCTSDHTSMNTTLLFSCASHEEQPRAPVNLHEEHNTVFKINILQIDAENHLVMRLSRNNFLNVAPSHRHAYLRRSPRPSPKRR